MQDLLRSRRGLVASAAVVILCIIGFFLFTASNWRSSLNNPPAPVASTPSSSGGTAPNQTASSGNASQPQSSAAPSEQRTAANSAGQPVPEAASPAIGGATSEPEPPHRSSPSDKAASLATSTPVPAPRPAPPSPAPTPAPACANAPAVVEKPATPEPSANSQAAGTAPSADAPAKQAQAGTVPPSTTALPVSTTPGQPSGAASANDRTPSFDILRVEPNGDSVIAARGAPNADIDLLDNGSPVAHATTDANGQVAFLPPSLKPGEHNLVLSMRSPTGHPAVSSQSVAVSIPAQPKTAPMVALIQPNQPAAVLSGPVAGSEVPTAVTPGNAIGSGDAGKPNQPGAPVAIRSVEVESKGSFYASGHAPAGSKSRVYLNDAYVATVTAGPNGSWSLRINHGLTPGHYEVRADQIEPDGRVVARAQVPFEYPAQVASVAPGNDAAKKKSDTPNVVADASRPAGDTSAARAAQTGADDPAAAGAGGRASASTVATPAGAPGATPVTPGRVGAGAAGAAVDALGGADRTGAATQEPGSPAGRPPLSVAEGSKLPAVTPPAGAARSADVSASQQNGQTHEVAGEPKSAGESAQPAAGASATEAHPASATAQAAIASPKAPAPSSPPAGQPSNTVGASAGATIASSSERAPSSSGAGPSASAPTPPGVGTEPSRAANAKSRNADEAANDGDNPTVVEELLTAKVVRGDSLWRISRHMLGHGIRYTQIYAVNTQEIRDPSLIYPGQVFVLPQE